MKCWMITQPSVTVIYCHPMINGSYRDLAHRFVAACVSNPAGYEHRLLVVCNGGQPTQETRNLFSPLANVCWMSHDNRGYDLGAFRAGAMADNSELVLFVGASGFPTKPGWLKRAVDAYLKHGRGLYGSTHNTGDFRFNVHPHIRTTGFWLERTVFLSYPGDLFNTGNRYGVEHGKDCLTNWIRLQRHHAWVVTWEGEYHEQSWSGIPNSFHRGDQSGLLFRDRLTEPPYY